MRRRRPINVFGAEGAEKMKNQRRRRRKGGMEWAGWGRICWGFVIGKDLTASSGKSLKFWKFVEFFGNL